MHESFDDFLAIIQTGTDDYHRHRNTEKVLKILNALSEQQMQDQIKVLADARLRSTSYYNQQRSTALEKELATLKNRILQVQRYNEALIAFLLYRAENCVLDEPLTWAIGDGVPQSRKESCVPNQNDSKFEIPAGFLCPISTELMEGT